MPNQTPAHPARADVVNFADQLRHELAHAGARSNLDDISAMLVAERARSITAGALYYTIAHLVEGSLGASCSTSCAIDFFCAEWLRRAGEGVRPSPQQDAFLAFSRDAIRDAKALYDSSAAMWFRRLASAPMAEVAQ